jgi:two-component system, OmpR family, sensor histidine kinase VicK
MGVSVEDTGCGISEAHRARIFERLFQVDSSALHSERGLGLGLHICKQIVERHRGHIAVESRLGKGSTFYFTLPLEGEGP